MTIVTNIYFIIAYLEKTMIKLKNNQSPVFSAELEELINDYGTDFPRHSLKNFLSAGIISEMTEELLEDEEWDLLEIAIAAIFLENRSGELTSPLLSTFGDFLYNNYEKKIQIEKTFLLALDYASKKQLSTVIKTLEELDMQFSYSDDFEIAIFYKNIKDCLVQHKDVKQVANNTTESTNYQNQLNSYLNSLGNLALAS